MIRINLATRKRMMISAAEGGPPPSGLMAQLQELRNRFKLGGGGGGGSLSNIRLDGAIFRDGRVRQLVVYVVIAIVSYVVVNGFKQDQIKSVEDEINQAQQKKVALDAEMGKYKNYEVQRKQLEEDETTIRTKLRTIQTLIVDRQTTPKFLMAISSEIPSTAWLVEFNFNATEMAIKGYAMGYAQISDFMKALGENINLSDVKLVSTYRVADLKEYPGIHVAAFELSARRRSTQ